VTVHGTVSLSGVVEQFVSPGEQNWLSATAPLPLTTLWFDEPHRQRTVWPAEIVTELAWNVRMLLGPTVTVVGPKAAVTVRLVVTERLHEPVPEQDPPQPSKIEPAPVTSAVRLTAVP
jgi:hypothetical protein